MSSRKKSCKKDQDDDFSEEKTPKRKNYRRIALCVPIKLPRLENSFGKPSAQQT